MTWTSNASVCARPHVENNPRPLRPFCSSHNTIVELSELLFGENCVQVVFFPCSCRGCPCQKGSLPHCSFFLRNCMMTHGKQARALFVAVVPRGFNLNAPSPLQACRVEGLFGHLRFCSRLLHKLFAFRLGLLEDAGGPVRNSLAQALLILRRPVKKSKGVATMRHRPDSLRSMH